MQPARSAQLASWYDAHAAAMVLYARQWLEEASAQDVVQEVFLHVLGRAGEGRNVRAWLFASVRNAALNQLRSLQRRGRHEQARAQQGGWFEARGDALIDARAAREALESLGQAQREIVMLRIWAGLTYEEIAAMLGLSLSGVFRQYQAALTAMRQKMEKPCKTKNE
jgi:RNA polymerase sigma-70 factor (ECF subfamily)